MAEKTFDWQHVRSMIFVDVSGYTTPYYGDLAKRLLHDSNFSDR